MLTQHGRAQMQTCASDGSKGGTSDGPLNRGDPQVLEGKEYFEWKVGGGDDGIRTHETLSGLLP